MSSSTPGRGDIVLETTENPDGNHVACFECETTFDPLEAFHGDGCPGCDASQNRLFEQRDEAEKQATRDLITEAEPQEAES